MSTHNEFKTKMANAWDSVSDGWGENADKANDLMREGTDVMIAEAKIGKGSKVLDIGCGPGEPTLDIARTHPESTVVGADLAVGMVEQAKRRAAEAGLSNVQFVVCDGEGTFESEEVSKLAPFDAVTARFALMFFEDVDSFFTKLVQAPLLRPGGRFTSMVWGTKEQADFITVHGRALAAWREDLMPPKRVGGRPPWALSDPVALKAKMEAAGLVDVEVRRHDVTFKFASPEEFVATQGGKSSTHSHIKKMGDDVYAEFVAQVAQYTKEHYGLEDGSVAISNCVYYTAMATKPE